MSVFFCDTDCELWYTTAKELGVKVIPMPYTIDGEEKLYDLGENTDLKDFFDRMRKLAQATGNEVLILNGDTLFDADIEALVAAHRQRGAALSMALKPMEHFDRYGTVTTDGEGRVTAFHEKRFCTQGTINGGVYILQTHNSLFDGMPARFSFETEILEKQVGKGNLFGFPDNGYFIDIGIPSDYAKAETDFKNMFDGTTR